MLLLIGCLVSFKFILNSLVSFLMEKYRIRFNLDYVLHKGNKKIICTIFLTKIHNISHRKIRYSYMFYTRETNNTFFSILYISYLWGSVLWMSSKVLLWPFPWVSHSGTFDDVWWNSSCTSSVFISFMWVTFLRMQCTTQKSLACRFSPKRGASAEDCGNSKELV